MNDRVIHVKGLHKSYKMGRVNLHVLRGLGFSVNRGEFVAVVGASGGGKSTLLHVVGLLDRQDKGEVEVDGQNIASLSAGRRNRMRCDDIGFVFQFYHLLEELNVLENVLLPIKVSCSTLRWFARRKDAHRRAEEILDRVGLAERTKHRPRELSGGERQRAAIARALINGPDILLADEPTGNLDSKTGAEIMEVIHDFGSAEGRTVVMVTHDHSLAGQADRVLHLADGRLSE